MISIAAPEDKITKSNLPINALHTHAYKNKKQSSTMHVALRASQVHPTHHF